MIVNELQGILPQACRQGVVLLWELGRRGGLGRTAGGEGNGKVKVGGRDGGDKCQEAQWGTKAVGVYRVSSWRRLRGAWGTGGKEGVGEA